MIDVPDVPGHQIRVYELHYVYPKNGMVIDGVQVKESTTYGSSDYTNWTGLFNVYSVFMLEDGNKIFARGGGATQTASDGRRSYSFTTQIIGGTGRFTAIRGQLQGRGERGIGANSVTESNTSGDYWFEK